MNNQPRGFSWRLLRDEKGKSTNTRERLEVAFKELPKPIGPVAKHNILSASFEVPNTSGQTFLKGNWVIREENVRKLFAKLAGLEHWEKEKISPADERAIQKGIEKYCEVEERPVQARKPRTTRDIRRSNRAQSSLPPLERAVVYVKFLHLREMKPGNSCIYRKVIRRTSEMTEMDMTLGVVKEQEITKEVEVFDEFVVVRTFEFVSPPAPFELFAKSQGYIYLQPTFPPRIEARPQILSGHVPMHTIGHYERKPETLMQGAFTFINNFQREKTVIGLLMIQDCSRFTMTVDFSSLPIDIDTLFVEPPIGRHIRQADPEQILWMQVHKTAAGSFFIDSSLPGKEGTSEQAWNPSQHSLLKDDRMEIRFFVNWAALL